MASDTQTAPVSKKMLWAGRVVSAVPVLVLLISGGSKLAKPPQVTEGFTHLGFDPKVAFGLGILELTCTLLYVIPGTSVLGAILLTGYLGGAIGTHVRLGEPAIGQTVFGVLVWLGLFLRDARIRALIPLRRTEA
jgi:uncharacterized membrane protein YphA (DoxX/SURF4 family)